MDIELKNAIENSNKLIAATRDAVETKADAATVSRIEADLAKALEEKAALESRLTAIETKANRPGNFGTQPEVDEHKSAFIDYLRDPKAHTTRDRVEREQKAAAITVAGTDGVAIPRVIASGILETLNSVSPIREFASVVTVSSTDYVELLDKANAGTVWVGETDDRDVTTSPDIARITPAFGEQHAIVEVSTHALQDATFGLEAWLTASLVKKFAEGEGKAFVSGNGTNKPKGLLSSGNGFGLIKTGVADGLGTNPHDRLLDLFYGINGGYRADGSWLMNSGTLATLAKIKDANGQYLYQPSLIAGEFDKIHGKRVVIAEDMPNIAANATPVAFGDLSRGYLITDIAGMSLIVDPYTRPGFVKFVAAKRVGGTPRDTAAIKLLSIAA
ncbi:phage major capsid protein [Paracoccus sulfuroxidans]|uniref:HK97 family phage major capsid protein n=1 Tax=Paracoccus sulfuroxidans TaxID=384678 RepID=A0A562P1M8_9RHOB|nr:phage major capsid protein [Paracoccus sulfuroxidans]TWI38233.1 HK97 family phage major capsid protein [Paracoccus sulfuroxidans]